MREPGDAVSGKIAFTRLASGASEARRPAKTAEVGLKSPSLMFPGLRNNDGHLDEVAVVLADVNLV
jgi:hypothetical protein